MNGGVSDGVGGGVRGARRSALFYKRYNYDGKTPIKNLFTEDQLVIRFGSGRGAILRGVLCVRWEGVCREGLTAHPPRQRVGLAEKSGVLHVFKVYWRPQLIIKIRRLFKT